MAFKSLKSRISSLPLVLVGPILRKVTDKSVSVFIVVKEESDVALKVFDGENNPVLNSSSKTVKLGQFVHALTITATSDEPKLRTNLVYFYNLEFNKIPMIQSSGSLRNGILQNENYKLAHGLTYSDHIYPSFVLPADNKSHLKFTHGSCRKPHGGKTDALRGLDTILSLTITKVTGYPMATSAETIEHIYQRPQFLCFTGDQIYADDVSDCLLFLIMDMESHLFNWASPTAGEALPGNPSVDDLKPGCRQQLLAKKSDETHSDQLSSSDAKSHLIKLAEFYAMYLLVWSDVLWPEISSDFPDFSAVFKTSNPCSDKKTFKREEAKLLEFKKSLPFIRRALANIPTYMIFDDHEITDDWFITKLWTENTIKKNTLSRRVIQNGLSAFAVFQAWGNTPELFSSKNGHLLLSELESLNTQGGGNRSVWDSIGDLLLPKLHNSHLRGGFDWHFHLDFKLFRLIFIDSRTKREFDSSEGPAALIRTAEMKNQIDIKSDLAIVVSPTPIIGNYEIEKFQQQQNIYKRDKEAWVFNQSALQNLLKILSGFKSTILLSGDVHYGFTVSVDYWNYRTGSMQKSGMTQLCSSSIKNSDINTERAASWTSFKPKLTNYTFLCWAKPGTHVKEKVGKGTTKDIFVGGTPAVYQQTNEYDSTKTTPDWSYQVTFKQDNRWKILRVAPGLNPLVSSNEQVKAGYMQYNLFWSDLHRYIVGRDNIGFVKVTDNNSLNHEFWYVLDPIGSASNKVLQPYTIHKDVNIAPPTGKMPGKK